MAKRIDVKRKTGAKPKAPAKKTIKKVVPKNPVKKTPKKELTARGRTKLNQAPKTKKNPMGGGRPTQIEEVINRLQKYAKTLPIFSLAKVTTIARVDSRTLEAYFSRGREEFEKGIPEWDGRGKKGSHFVRFYRMILIGREMAIMRATRTYLLGVDTDWKAAAKFLATVMSEHWSEKLKIEHSGNIDSEVTVTMRKIHDYAERARENNKSK